MRRLKEISKWPPGGWNYEEPATGFRFRGSSLQDLAAKVKLHREVNYLGREDRVEEDIQEQIILKAPEEFDGWEEVPASVV
jgi:hypothetical protein